MNNCTDNCMTGGKVLSVFFCVLMGSIALGQVRYFSGSSSCALLHTVCIS